MILDPSVYDGPPEDLASLAEQVCRVWAARSQYPWRLGSVPRTGLSMAEPDGDAPANIYAHALPARTLRHPVAAAVAIEAASRTTPADPTWTAILSAECHEATPRLAVRLAGDLVQALLPGRRWLHEPVERGGVDLRGAIGLPPIEPGQRLAFWRLMSVEISRGPIWIPQGQTQRSGDGQSLAEVDLVITALPVLWEEPS